MLQRIQNAVTQGVTRFYIEAEKARAKQAEAAPVETPELPKKSA